MVAIDRLVCWWCRCRCYFNGLGRLLISASRKRYVSGVPLVPAMAGLQRRAAQNSVQMLSFSTAIMLLLLVIVLRNDLLEDWKHS